MIIVVHNPSSGGGDMLDHIKQAFAAHGQTPKYLTITDSDFRTSLHSATKQPKTIIVAAGGDGTVNAVAEALRETHAALGIIPAGTLNHFAKELGIPLDIPQAVAVILKGKAQKVDLGTVNDHVFINNSSIGWYPRSLQTRNEYDRMLGKWPAALLGYVRATLQPRRYHVSLLIEGQEHLYHTPFVFVSNNAYQRPGAGKRETLQGGQLAVHVVKAQSIWGILRMLTHGLFTRKHRTRDFAIYTASECTIRTRHHNRLRVARDGEVTTLEAPLRYKSDPASLRVITP